QSRHVDPIGMLASALQSPPHCGPRVSEHWFPHLTLLDGTPSKPSLRLAARGNPLDPSWLIRVWLRREQKSKASSSRFPNSAEVLRSAAAGSRKLYVLVLERKRA